MYLISPKIINLISKIINLLTLQTISKKAHASYLQVYYLF